MKPVLLPCSHADARAAVARWHSHHKPQVGERIAIGAHVDGALVAVVVVGRPVAPSLAADPACEEVTRLAVGPDAPHCTASLLLGAAWRSRAACGIRRLISYTRIDEAGTCYRAAGWVPTAIGVGREWTSGNKSARWLPGLYVPSSEVVDRVRWEGKGNLNLRLTDGTFSK